MKRNLIYYVCPFAQNVEWERNISELMKNISIFDNKIVVTIAKGPRMVDPKRVREKFDGFDVKFLEIPNDRATGEVIPFIKMLNEVKSKNSDEMTFYAHTKGTSPRYSEEGNELKLRNKTAWRNIMYHFNLNHIESVEKCIEKRPFFGVIKRTERTHILGGSKAKWFYAGNFFWFRNDVFFGNDDWNVIRMNRMGVEAYLGEKYHEEMGDCLFGSDMPFAIVDYDDQKWEDYLGKYNLKLTDFYGENR